MDQRQSNSGRNSKEMLGRKIQKRGTLDYKRSDEFAELGDDKTKIRFVK